MNNYCSLERFRLSTRLSIRLVLNHVSKKKAEFDHAKIKIIISLSNA